MPKINVYLPDDLAEAVKEAQLPVSAICQGALQQAVRDVTAARATDSAPRTFDAPGMGRLGSRFTPRARHAVARAQDAARELGNNFVGTEHLLLGVLREPGNLALQVLHALDVDPADVDAEAVATIASSTERAMPCDDESLPFTKLSKQALETTAKEAIALAHNYIGCEHLLLGLLATDDGTASQVLRRMGLELRTTRRTIVTVLSGYVQAKTDAAAGAKATETDTMQQILRRLDAIEQRLAG